jgi:hypothetical protein
MVCAPTRCGAGFDANGFLRRHRHGHIAARQQGQQEGDKGGGGFADGEHDFARRAVVSALIPAGEGIHEGGVGDDLIAVKQGGLIAEGREAFDQPLRGHQTPPR